jgi:AcrR family transcriptional regulator
MNARSPQKDPRGRVVEAALRLLSEGGPDALQARRLAAEVGTSTMAVYTHFDGMPGVVKAVVEEGFRRLADALARFGATGDPVADILLRGMAYRRTALENPHLYGVMFGLTAPGGRRIRGNDLTTTHTPAEDGEGRRAFDLLTEATTRAIDAGRFHPGEPYVAAAQLWSGLHGYVTLEIAGYFGEEGRGVEQVFAPFGITLAVGLGDDREAAERSMGVVARTSGPSATMR